MRVNTINLQMVINLGNYETLRVGAEWTPDSNQTMEEAMLAADKELRESASALLQARGGVEKTAPVQQPAAPANVAPAAQNEPEKKDAAAAPAPEAKTETPAADPKDDRELLTFENPKLQKVIKRIEAGVSLDTVAQYYRFDDNAKKAVEMAAKLNVKK